MWLLVEKSACSKVWALWSSTSICLTCSMDIMRFVQNKERPLHIAARHGHVKMVEALLDDEARPQLKSMVNNFRLHVDITVI